MNEKDKIEDDYAYCNCISISPQTRAVEDYSYFKED